MVLLNATVTRALGQFTLLSVGHINNGGTASDLAVSGNYVYLANESDGLRIYDVTDPTNPVNIAHATNSGSANDVVISSNYAYLANGGDGLHIYDVSDPTNPVSVGQIYKGNFSITLVVTNNYAYVGDTSGFQIFNVSNPASPYFVSSTPLSYGPGVDISGSYLYLADGVDGLRIYDVSNPTTATSVGHIVQNGANAIWVMVSGAFAYVVSWNDGLRIYNITNPATPFNVGHTNTSAVTFGVAVAGNYAYVAEGNGVGVYDVSNPTNPITVGQVKTSVQAYGLAVKRNYIYVANSTDGLRIYLMLPQLHASLSISNSVVLTWPVSAAPFLLEENSDLTTTNWTIVTNAPIVAGQQNQVIFARSSADKFYRLKPGGN